MRLLVVTPFPPDPGADHGGAVYLGALVEALAARAAVSVACLTDRAAPPPRAPKGVVDFVAVPHTLLRTAPTSARLPHRARMARNWLARGQPLLVAKHASAALHRAIARLTDDGASFDAVLLEMAVMAQYRSSVAAGTTTVLTDHEAGPPGADAIGLGGLGRGRDARLWQRYVARTFAAVDRLQALTDDDAGELGDRLQRPVGVRPLAVPVPSRAVAPERAPRRAVFVGNFLHRPNVEAAQRCATRIWPKVRAAVADAELWLVGAHPPLELTRSAAAGVRATGRVDDLAAVLAQARLLLAPVFAGAGARVKVLDALARGLPVVSNPLGLRGIDAMAARAGVGASDDELARHVVTWLEDPASAAAAGAAGRRWVVEHRSPDAVAEIQLAALLG